MMARILRKTALGVAIMIALPFLTIAFFAGLTDGGPKGRGR